MSSTASNNNNASFDSSAKVEVIVLPKSDKTLKNNIDAKDETIRKRTSLVIVPQQQEEVYHNGNDDNANTVSSSTFSNTDNSNEFDTIDAETTSTLKSIKKQLLKSSTSSSYSNSSRTASRNCSSSSSTAEEENQIEKLSSNSKTTSDKNKNNSSNRNSIASVDSCVSRTSHSSSSTTTTESNTSDDVVIEDYPDMEENDNIIDDLLLDDVDHKHCMSNSSSLIDDYSLREKLQNYVYDTLDAKKEDSISTVADEAHNKLDTVNMLPKNLSPMTCDALLSPQEAPMGRRYAEVSQFKAIKRSSDPNSQLSSSVVHQQTQAQNQLNSSTAATTTSATSNGNSNINSNSSSNNNNNNINNRRLPFCGLDSIKGSDNNGEIVGGGERECESGVATNLSFELNLQSGNVIESGSGIGGDIGADAKSEQFHSLDANDSSCCYDGQFEDDMQALLPKCKRLSRDELSQSLTSLVSSSDGGILAESETSSETSRGTDDCPSCDLGLGERLLLTHPVWFLPGIQRSGAVHFLQGKEEGNFIVRGSSQPNTMAVSVRLPPDTGPYIEHYLIQSNDGILSLESSRFKFDSIPALIAHYAQCCDELPVQLVLPRALREAKNRQQLSSLALLGQEFWRYPMSCSKPSETEATVLDAKSPNSLTETSGLGTTVFSNSAGSSCVQQSTKTFSPTNNFTGIFSQAGTPSDTTSSMSSFTTSGGQQMQLMSPESVDSIILTMSPVDVNNQRNGVVGLCSGTELCNAPSILSTFRSNNSVQIPYKMNKNLGDNSIRPQRPKPPNTLNLDLRKPPAPPLRWSKPVSPSSPLPPGHVLNQANNFTVTTTVTFSMENKSSPQIVEVTTPAANNSLNSVVNSNTTFQTFSKRLSPEGECKDTLSSQGSSNGSRWQSQSSKDSNNSQRKMFSPCSAGTTTSVTGGGSSKSRKSKARKESKHYQESDILESPQIYCRSALGDKISDYEDLWSQDPSDRTGLLKSFKPTDGVQGKRPDLLAETPTITSLNSNLLSPANSSIVSASPQHDNNVTAIPTAETSSETQQLIQFSAEAQPRSRAGLLLPGLMTQSLSVDPLNEDLTTEGDSTPTMQTPISRSKQGSPFYAEPADALRQAGITTASILRRSQRAPLLPANHRHSEPPKSGIVRTQMCPLLIPSEIEKIAGSLDELKKKQQRQQAQPQQQPSSKRTRGRFEQWQLDSSWEFMSKQDDDDGNHGNSNGDYDSEERWKQQPQCSQAKENSLVLHDINENKQRPITVHQIIAKRLPDLNLPELVRCSTPPQQQQNAVKSFHENNGCQKSLDCQNGSRLSSYDNVERNYSFCQSFFNGTDSAQSDDGTVFSEPWDSSQWDSFMPQDDITITSDNTIHLSKGRPVVSEDDTIIEELCTKESNQDTLKAKKTNGRQKVATILRNPSMRDREILSTVHKILIHGPAIIEYALVSIGELSEEAAESRNKDIQKFRLQHTRKMSRVTTNEDLFNRLLLTSDPFITGQRKLPPKHKSVLNKSVFDLLD